MLIFALIGAMFLYVVLYFLWAEAQSHVGVSMFVLKTLNDLLFMPQHNIFLIFRAIILITLVYVVVDFLLSSVRHHLKRQSDKKGAQSVNRI